MTAGQRYLETVAEVSEINSEVSVLPIPKRQPVDRVRSVVQAGASTFGASRREELDDGWTVAWEFVGPIQSRKVRAIAPHVTRIHSLDRTSLVNKLAVLDDPPPVLVQVNLAAEPNKSGALPEGVPALVEAALAAGIVVDGFSAIPPKPEHPEDSRRWFAQMRSLAERMSREYQVGGELSMGMSRDYRVAVEEGATIVRVGEGIFGRRATTTPN